MKIRRLFLSSAFDAVKVDGFAIVSARREVCLSEKTRENFKAIAEYVKKGRFLPGVKSERLLCGLCFACSIRDPQRQCRREEWVGLETGTVSRTLLAKH